jgi:hypothetical protein
MQRALCLLVVGVMCVALALLLSGCADLASKQLEVFYGLDCRPEHLDHGNCVPVKKSTPDAHGGTNAQTAKP